MILIIDDDSAIRSSLSFMLKRAGYTVQAVPGPREAIETVRLQAPDLILMDMNFTLSTTGEEGLTLLRQVKVFRPEVPVILMNRSSAAYQAPGTTPPCCKRIETALALTSPRPRRTNRRPTRLDRSRIIGKSRGLTDVLDTVARIAPHQRLRAHHRRERHRQRTDSRSHPPQQPPARDNPSSRSTWGGISQSLFESEMFGHKKGAFTDATSDRIGRFELADRGTIFLDEIGDL